MGHLEYISTLGDIMVTVAMSTLRGKFSMSEGYHEYTGVGVGGDSITTLGDVQHIRQISRFIWDISLSTMGDAQYIVAFHTNRMVFISEVPI